MSIIFASSMREESRGDDGGIQQQLKDSIQAISPQLHAEFKREGTQHPLAGKTLSEIRAIAAAGELPTEGSEVRIKRRHAAMCEWNRRIQDDELTKEQIQRFESSSAYDALRELGWENPY